MEGMENEDKDVERWWLGRVRECQLGNVICVLDDIRWIWEGVPVDHAKASEA